MAGSHLSVVSSWLRGQLGSLLWGLWAGIIYAGPGTVLKWRYYMSEFKNVTVVKKANVYFDGKVTSRTVLFPDGSKKTLGVMLPGDFEFGTADKEFMEILSGELDVLLPNETAWKPVKEGQSFEVAANSKFKLKVKKLTDYC